MDAIKQRAAKLVAKTVAARCFDARLEFVAMVEAHVAGECEEQQGQATLQWIMKEGGVFVKMGQIVAQRPDVQASGDIRNALKALQCDCASIPFSMLEGRSELEDLVEKVSPMDKVNDTPLSAASVAQVYELGTNKVFKVTSPSNLGKFQKQFEGLAQAANWLFFKYSPLAEVNRVAQVFMPMILREFDMEVEAASLKGARLEVERLGEQVPGVIVPEVFGHTRRGLVMERLKGVPLTEILRRPQGHDGLAKEAVRKAIDYIGRSLFGKGPVHCDPHAGNFLLLGGLDGDEATVRIGVIDFGCVANFEESERKAWRVVFSRLEEFSRASEPSSAKLRSSAGPAELEIAKAMLQLGFRTRHNSTKGLATLALVAFDSTQPPSLQAMERGSLGLSEDPAASPLPGQPALVMRAVVLLGGLHREVGDINLNTMKVWGPIAQAALQHDASQVSMRGGEEDASQESHAPEPVTTTGDVQQENGRSSTP